MEILAKSSAYKGTLLRQSNITAALSKLMRCSTTEKVLPVIQAILESFTLKREILRKGGPFLIWRYLLTRSSRDPSGQARHLVDISRLHAKTGNEVMGRALLPKALALYETLQKWADAASTAIDLAKIIRQRRQFRRCCFTL